MMITQPMLKAALDRIPHWRTYQRFAALGDSDWCLVPYVFWCTVH